MKLFHAARRSARESIETQGLQMRDPRVTAFTGVNNPAAVYAFEDEKWCDWHAKQYADDFDVWEITVPADAEVVVDESHRALGGRAILQNIGPENLRMVREIAKGRKDSER